MMSLKKKLRFKLKFKTFKTLKTIIFNRKIYKKLNLTKKNQNYLKKYQIKQNIIFSHLYFPYEFFFKNYFKSGLITKQKFSYFYGFIKFKTLKKNYRKLKKKSNNNNYSNFYHKNLFFLSFFEKRIDSVLYRTYFALNLKQVKFFILHKHVKINKKTINNSFILLQPGDCISFSQNCSQILKKNIFHNLKFEFLPKSFEINFKTFEIFYLNKFKNFLYLNNLNNLDTFNLDYSLNSLFRFLKNN